MHRIAWKVRLLLTAKLAAHNQLKGSEPAQMSRKRPAQDEPPQEQEGDVMEPTRQLMYELASARQALLNHAAAINDCLRVTDHLAQLLTAAQRGVQTRTSMLSDEQASLLALRHACQMVSQQQQLSM